MTMGIIMMDCIGCVLVWLQGSRCVSDHLTYCLYV